MRDFFQHALDPNIHLRRRLFQLLSTIALAEFIIVTLYTAILNTSPLSVAVMLFGTFLFAITVSLTFKSGRMRLGATISGLLIVASSAIIKDVYLHQQHKKGKEPGTKQLRLLSMLATAVIGVVVFVIALTPPSLIWIINMFAFGGLETAFFWMLLLGLFWRRAAGRRVCADLCVPCHAELGADCLACPVCPG